MISDERPFDLSINAITAAAAQRSTPWSCSCPELISTSCPVPTVLTRGQTRAGAWRSAPWDLKGLSTAEPTWIINWFCLFSQDVWSREDVGKTLLFGRATFSNTSAAHLCQKLCQAWRFLFLIQKPRNCVCTPENCRKHATFKKKKKSLLMDRPVFFLFIILDPELGHLHFGIKI